MTRTGIGPMRSASVPAATTTSPSGLSRSLAILATSLDDAMPTDAVSPPVTSWMRSLSPWPSVDSESGSVPGRSPAARSTNASSTLSGSTSGDSERSSAMITRLTWR